MAIWETINFYAIFVVLYGVFPLCGLSVYLALKKRSRPVMGGVIAISNLLATVHIFSYSALWAGAFRKSLTGPAWQLFAVSRKTSFGIAYTAALLIASLTCLFVNGYVLFQQTRSREFIKS